MIEQFDEYMSRPETQAAFEASTGKEQRQIKAVCDLIADQFGISTDDLMGPCRKRHIARPRQFAMWMLRTQYGLSLSRIGEAFDRDHTTVLFAISAVEKRMN